MRASRLAFDSANKQRLSHYLFRYPAKFHPPVVRKLLEMYTDEGSTVLDPFCGSGTLLVEAAVLGRDAIGVDVDPVAAFVSAVKTRFYRIRSLESDSQRLLSRLEKLRRSDTEYERRKFDDIAESTFQRNLRQGGLWTPDIPNIQHWFRRYVIVDLSRINRVIRRGRFSARHKEFFLLCFAAALRNSSNADPVPVSGLEVTKHMRAIDEAGRVIDPYSVFESTLKRSLDGIRDFVDQRASGVKMQVDCADFAQMTRRMRVVDAVITSPPYHGAVEYYRRHKLEMYWLKMTNSHDERLELLQHYIGRPQVPASHPYVKDSDLEGLPLVQMWERRMRKASEKRANALRHYAVGMRAVMKRLGALLSPGRPAVFIVGKSQWNGRQIPTEALFRELAEEWFDLRSRYWYPVKNRYMSYGRHNGADINREEVLVLSRKG